MAQMTYEQSAQDSAFPASRERTSVRAGEQAPARVILVRPHHFVPNPVTASDNAFQRTLPEAPAAVAVRARREVTGLAEVLESAGVEVAVFDDPAAVTPDSVFPNNWFSTHPGRHRGAVPDVCAEPAGRAAGGHHRPAEGGLLRAEGDRLLRCRA